MYFLPDVNKDRIKMRDEIEELLSSEEAEQLGQETKDMLIWALNDLNTGKVEDYFKGKAYYNYYKEGLKEPKQPKLEEVDKQIRENVDNNLKEANDKISTMVDKDIRNGEWKSGN